MQEMMLTLPKPLGQGAHLDNFVDKDAYDNYVREKKKSDFYLGKTPFSS
jgi:hypothetical protein